LDEQAAQESPSKASALATAIKQKRQQKTEAIRRRFQQEAWYVAHIRKEITTRGMRRARRMSLASPCNPDGESNGSEDERVCETARKEQVSQKVKNMLDLSADDDSGNAEESGDER
jgi:hypothetical protein